MGRIGSIILAATAAVALAACGDGAATGLALDGGGEEVTVSVSEGVTPDYTWSGGPARELVVTTVGGEVVWEIEAVDIAAGFSSPLGHGQTPETAVEVTAEAILDTGVRYVATVTLVDGSEGSVEFVP